eukprot:scaffold164499_cov33-Tisochrysis_lutea.AAC.1
MPVAATKLVSKAASMGIVATKGIRIKGNIVAFEMEMANDSLVLLLLMTMQLRRGRSDCAHKGHPVSGRAGRAARPSLGWERPLP